MAIISNVHGARVELEAAFRIISLWRQNSFLHTYSEEGRAEERPVGQGLEYLGLGFSRGQALDLFPTGLDHVDPLRWLDVLSREGWLG